MFQSLSGNSSVVGSGGSGSGSVTVTDGFNPFQGIQVLSVGVAELLKNASLVSIPFREFKCCRHGILSLYGDAFQVSIPFREFKCCREKAVYHVDTWPFVSIPFREFKCCRDVADRYGIHRNTSFNPFQGIQVLSGQVQSALTNRCIVSIPFREFKCCRPDMPDTRSCLSAAKFQSLSGNSSVVGSGKRIMPLSG